MRLHLSVCFMIFSAISFGQKTQTIYRTAGDSIQNYYRILTPAGRPKGLLVVLGGFCTTPDEVLLETQLPAVARKAGYTVVIPYLVDDCTVTDTKNLYQSRLESLITEVITQYAIPPNQFIIGGQSWGGYRALRYTEAAYKQNDSRVIKPNGVFGVDPPLNMKRLWNSFVYGVRINFSPASVSEGNEMLKRFNRMFGGSPSQQPKSYETASAYYPEAKDGGNAQYLKGIPVRLYCDPDIDWTIENRRGSFELMNAADLSGCISQLKLLGNKQAEFINCLGKGVKPDGTRHPHYFSMLNPDEFVNWANQVLGVK